MQPALRELDLEGVATEAVLLIGSPAVERPSIASRHVQRCPIGGRQWRALQAAYELVRPSPAPLRSVVHVFDLI